MYFDLKDCDLGKMILSVKGENIRHSDVRDLDLTRSVGTDAHIAGFLVLKKPTKAMQQTVDDAGLWYYKGESNERVQMLTVRGIVEEKRLFRTPARLQYRDDHLQMSM